MSNERESARKELRALAELAKVMPSASQPDLPPLSNRTPPPVPAESPPTWPSFPPVFVASAPPARPIAKPGASTGAMFGLLGLGVGAVALLGALVAAGVVYARAPRARVASSADGPAALKEKEPAAPKEKEEASRPIQPPPSEPATPSNPVASAVPARVSAQSSAPLQEAGRGMVRPSAPPPARPPQPKKGGETLEELMKKAVENDRKK